MPSDSTLDLPSSSVSIVGNAADVRLPDAGGAIVARAIETPQGAVAVEVGSDTQPPKGIGFDMSAWLVSAVAHAWLVVVLGVWLLHVDPPWGGPELVCSFSHPEQDVSFEPALVLASEQPVVRFERSLAMPLPATQVPSLSVELANDPARRFIAPALAGTGMRPARSGLPTSDLLRRIGPTGGGLAGRSPERRAALAEKHGGTAQSEAAVEKGLRWLMAHQMPDGSWRFDHSQHPHCQGACSDAGTIGSSTASTALALLPFLGAGYTHERGEYRRTVRNGLYYLSSRMVETRHGADLQEGTMYAQALATIVLCEAYSMTGDAALATIAQPALDFIAAAQHTGGGWRYYPGEPGDITSTGWQIMALKSGQLAKLRVRSPTFFLASDFLDQVQDDAGAAYGYQTPGRAPTTTAIGLLCRMYLGWSPSRPALIRGTDKLIEQGPSENDLYYNYYAAQVLHHQAARGWPEWNARLRDHLVACQADEGHEAGSWSLDDEKTNVAGRLFDTSMAILNLEVYYRYLPLYGDEATGIEP